MITAGAIVCVLAVKGGQELPAEPESAGCVSCHTQTEAASMHASGAVQISCVQCHGGNAQILRPAGSSGTSAEYRKAVQTAHPAVTNKLWRGSSANPERSGADWLKQDQMYIKFVNPGDLRVAGDTCGSARCHADEVRAVRTSMMTHGAMLWGAALYNNGAFPLKDAHFGESYSGWRYCPAHAQRNAAEPG